MRARHRRGRPDAQSLAVIASSRSANCARGRLAAGRHVLAGHAVGGRLVAAQDLPGHRLAVHLVGAVVDARRAREAVHLLERQVGRVAERAVRLHRAVDDVVQHLGAVELDQRDVLARRGDALGVHHPRGVQRHQPRRLHLGGGVGDPVLDGLLARPAGRRARSGTATRSHSMSNARRATPSQRMQWWMRPGHSRCWAIRKPSPCAPSSAPPGSADVLVEDLGVAAVAAEALPRDAPSSATSRTISHARACRRRR